MPRPRPNESKKPPARPAWLGPILAALLVVLVWLTFGGALRSGFVNFDDGDYVYANPQVQRGLTLPGVSYAFRERVSGNWHPLTVLSHMLDGQLFGLNPAGHHGVSLFLHSLAAVLLFLFLQRATAEVWPSVFVAAVFAIHPLRAESVVWISERKDVLSGVFFLLTLCAYLAYARRPSLPRYLLVALVFAGGLMAKSMLVTVPLVLLLLDRWPLRREVAPARLLLEKIPLLLLSLGAGLAALSTQTRALSTGEIPPGLRLGNAVVSFVVYLWQTFWPVRLSPFYPYPLDGIPVGWIAFSSLLLLALTAAAWRSRRGHPYFLTGWLWYLIMLLPVSGLIQVGLQAHADRYTYLPQIGLLCALAWGAAAVVSQRWPRRQQSLGVLAAVLVAALAFRAHGQAAIWRESESLWRHALAVNPDNYLAHGSLAKYFWSEKRLAEAIPHFEKALALRPDDADMHNQAGLGLMQMGKPAAAIAHWREALAYAPDNLNTQSNLAWVFATAPDPAQRDGARAVALAENVVARSGQKSPILLRTLAAAYAEAGRFSDAIATTREAAALARAHGDASLAAQLEGQIAQYELGFPLRDASLAEP